MSDCGVCLYGADDCEGADFYVLETRRAGKAHRCDECRKVIYKGERHEVVTGRWDGLFVRTRTCLDCVDIATSLSCNGSRMHGGLWEELESLRYEIGLGCIATLTRPTAKAKLQAWINERRGL
jgi:hypothetical protein